MLHNCCTDCLATVFLFLLVRHKHKTTQFILPGSASAGREVCRAVAWRTTADEQECSDVLHVSPKPNRCHSTAWFRGRFQHAQRPSARQRIERT